MIGPIITAAEVQIARAEMRLLDGCIIPARRIGFGVLIRGQKTAETVGCRRQARNVGGAVHQSFADKPVPQSAVKRQAPGDSAEHGILGNCGVSGKQVAAEVLAGSETSLASTA